MAGSAIVRALSRAGFRSVVGRTSDELDLRDRNAVWRFFDAERPKHVVLAAARVGGIGANSTRPVDFLSDNIQIQVNVMDAALTFGVERLLFLGSSCIYPRDSPQPISEDALLCGPLEPTNEAYAVAKIAGIQHVRAVRRQYGVPWISAMPTNLYGPGDNFSSTTSHVVPALIRRYVEAVDTGAPAVTNWGTGTPRRELLHVDDFAQAAVFLLDYYDDVRLINVGTGHDLAIADLARIVSELTEYTGVTHWDNWRPDGTPRKVLDISRLSVAGWSASIGLRHGQAETINWYRRH